MSQKPPLPQAEEGWGWCVDPPHNHYFVNGVALCKKERLTPQQSVPGYLDANLYRHPAQCRKCEELAFARRRQRRLKPKGKKR